MQGLPLKSKFELVTSRLEIYILTTNAQPELQILNGFDVIANNSIKVFPNWPMHYPSAVIV